MTSKVAGRPERGEYSPYYQRYIDRVPGEDPLALMRRQAEETIEFLRGVSEEKQEYAYGPGKWTVRQVISHLIDMERIFPYRALRFSRLDDQPVAAFDENRYVDNAELGDRTYASLLDELEYLRRANLEWFSNLRQEAWLRIGEANGQRVSVRALVYIIAGHFDHHLGILRERYGIA